MLRALTRQRKYLKAFVAAYQRLPDGGPAKAAFKDAYDRAIDDTEESSWIGLTYGRLKLEKLYSDIVAFPNGPLVFINACESAQLTPSLSGKSFVSFFLDRHASAVLGTECAMTPVFAHPFGELVLDRLLSGDAIGAALLGARRHFAAQRNPLGLAYSLYGNAGFHLPDV